MIALAPNAVDKGAVNLSSRRIKTLPDEQALNIWSTRIVRLLLFQSRARRPLCPGFNAAASSVSFF
jgi:hypothetical protein